MSFASRTPLTRFARPSAFLLVLLGCGEATAPADGGTPQSTPVATGPGVAAGRGVSCALAAGGEAYCWGNNRTGALGNPSVATDTAAPVRAGSGRYVAIAVTASNFTFGPVTACALQADGAADCWGSDPDGVLGPADPTDCAEGGFYEGTRAPCVRVPRRVAPALTFRRLSVGMGHLCGITTAGTTVCWGRGTEGQLGTGATASASAPAEVTGAPRLVDIAASDGFTCGVTAEGTAYCWGSNERGQLGDGTTTTRTTPVVAAAGIAIAQLDVGVNHVCAVTREAATVCWGAGSNRQLGRDGPFATGALYSTAALPVDLPAPTRLVSAGGGSCAIDTGGRLRCWGWNPYGQVGTADGSRCRGPVDSSACLPSEVGPALAFAEVSVASISACARTVDRAVYCWGNNLYGNIGDGTRRNALTPVRVPLP